MNATHRPNPVDPGHFTSAVSQEMIHLRWCLEVTTCRLISYCQYLLAVKVSTKGNGGASATAAKKVDVQLSTTTARSAGHSTDAGGK